MVKVAIGNVNVLVQAEFLEYFNLRPDVEKAFGYSHAVKIGTHIKISGAVSIDDEGSPSAANEEMLLRFGKGSKTLWLYLRRCGY